MRAIDLIDDAGAPPDRPAPLRIRADSTEPALQTAEARGNVLGAQCSAAPNQCPSASAGVPDSRLVDVPKQLDGPDVDAIVQVVVNLGMIRLAASAACSMNARPPER